MKKLFYLLVFATAFSFAQNYRFIYEYKYIPDIKQKDTVRKDMMALDITKTGSTYKSLGKIQRDSILHAQIEQIMKTGGAGNNSINMRGTKKPGMVDYEVTKEYPDYKIFLTERVGSQQYKISEDEKLVWKILPEKQKIGNYNAQKATADFGGRSWVAWFSTELPFQDGPYKFSGLPGLIVKIEDTTGSHSMTLVANKKLPEISENKKEPMMVSFGTPISVTEAQFKKAWQNYIADPAKDIRGMNSGTSGDGWSKSIVIMKDASGNAIDPAKMAKKMEEGVKYRLEHDNNKIEPALYK